MKAVSRADVVAAIRELGLPGRPVCLHASLRAFGHLEGGAATIPNVFLAHRCSVLVPSFSNMFEIPPPAHLRPVRNGWDYAKQEGRRSGLGRVYRKDRSDLDRDRMGAIAAEIVAMSGRSRGAHPLNSFSAVGPLARRLVAGQSCTHVYAPLEELVEADGFVLLMGVGLDKMTLLHLAEQRAGRVPFWRWANDDDGEPTLAQAGGCSRGFGNFQTPLTGLERLVTVGSACVWRLYRAQTALAATTQAIAAEPGITHCGDASCDRCRDAALGGPLPL